MASGRFVKGENRTFSKICSICQNPYISKSGSRKKCQECCKCKECGTQMKNGSHGLCSLSCGAKWKYKNSEVIRKIIQEGRKLGNTPEATEKMAAAQRGKPKLKLRKAIPNNSRERRHQAMQRIEYKLWRKAVFERDNYTCQICKSTGCYLEADHIIPYFIDPTQELDLNNGRALCRPCHMSLDSWGHKVKTRYKQIGSILN